MDYGMLRLRTQDGYWVTELTPNRFWEFSCSSILSSILFIVPNSVDFEHFWEVFSLNIAIILLRGYLSIYIYRSISLHCRPQSEAPASVEDAVRCSVLQRWVGVQYHPKTEISSHYGEMLASCAYNMVVFVDKTTNLNTDIEAALKNTTNVSADSAGAPGTGTSNKRLMAEYVRTMKTPTPHIDARPLEENLLEWHFVLHGTKDPYLDGKYHGVLEFPPEFPMKPPSIKMLTPSGRFETNTRLCLSMSDYHPESWNPSWSVETILLGLVSFMYEDTSRGEGLAIGSIRDTTENRRKFAAASEAFNHQNEIYMLLFGLHSMEGGQAAIAAMVEMDESADVCRFCFAGGKLVAPCACKGSTKWVHLDCLQQWQKSVLLIQPTHPRYQTAIDEICWNNWVSLTNYGELPVLRL